MRSLCRCVFVGFFAQVLWGCASAPPPKPTVFYQQLINNNARDVAASMARTYPITTDYDARTNTVVLRGPAEAVSAACLAIGKLEDIPVEGHPTSVFFIRKLKNANAGEVALRLQQMKPQVYHVANVTVAPGEGREVTILPPQTNAGVAEFAYPNSIRVDPQSNSLQIIADFTYEKETRAAIDTLDVPDKNR